MVTKIQDSDLRLFREFLAHRYEQGEITINMNGHHGFGLGEHHHSTTPHEFRFILGELVDTSWLGLLLWLAEEKQEGNQFVDMLIAHIQDSSNPLTEEVVFDVSSSIRLCSECGTKLDFRYDGKRIYCTTPQCEHVGGLPPYDVRIDIPSGRIVFANDMRSLIEPNWREVIPYFSVNGSLGKSREAKWFEERGMAFSFVGNTCPSIYQLKQDTLLIGWLYNEEGDDELLHSHGTITTDLWWYCAMDGDKFDSIKGDYDEDIVEINVPPGQYSFISYSHSDLYDYERDGIFSMVRKLRNK